ncbi:MAG: hypothetical protein ABJF09_13715 [Qipengyuania citrea]|uniref:hypothetical protein n=1 Tax=Qipengyuania citrea TaxID=225971 RepID=UPI003267E6BC
MSGKPNPTALADKLISLTNEGKLDWNEDPNDNDAPWVKVGDLFIVLREGRNAHGANLFRISLETDSEEVIDSFTDEELDAETSTDYYFKQLDLLFSKARRAASGADKALLQVLKGLDDLG